MEQRKSRRSPGLWITEIYQNDVKREDLFDNSSDHMEFVEVINTSDRSVELGSDYTLWYEYRRETPT